MCSSDLKTKEKDLIEMLETISMTTHRLIAYMQANVNLIANHLLVVAAFFLSIGASVPHDVFPLYIGRASCR